jgi:N4-gp56 family major capsid protein
MANTTVVSANQVLAWEDKFFAEYVRDSLFAPYMGTDENSIIQVSEKLGEGAGKTVTVSLVSRLTGTGVTGDNTLMDNEEALSNYGHALTIEQLRNGVRVGKMEQKHTVIDLLDAAKTMLKMWIMDDLRTDILNAMGSPCLDGKTAYASATEAQKDAWVTANNGRILFGNAVSNYSAADHSASLLNIDSTNDVLDFDIVQLAKRRAKKADRHIRPVKTKGGREWFVMFCESFGFRDLKTDTETIHQYAGDRGSDNPLFTDPDLMLDGVICREVPEIAVLSNVGNGGTTDVGQHFMCGAQAVGLAWGQRSKFATETFDYGNQKGVAVSEVRGVEKLTFNNLQNGIHTIYASGVADS